MTKMSLPKDQNYDTNAKRSEKLIFFEWLVDLLELEKIETFLKNDWNIF